MSAVKLCRTCRPCRQVKQGEPAEGHAATRALYWNSLLPRHAWLVHTAAPPLLTVAALVTAFTGKKELSVHAVGLAAALVTLAEFVPLRPDPVFRNSVVAGGLPPRTAILQTALIGALVTAALAALARLAAQMSGDDASSLEDWVVPALFISLPAVLVVTGLVEERFIAVVDDAGVATQEKSRDTAVPAKSP